MHHPATVFRNFFAATDTASLHQAFAALPAQLNGTFNVAQEEYTFNRLFVGPQAALSPPYASVWLSLEKLLMTEHTLRMRDFYTMLNVQAPEGVPDDYLPLELEAYLMLQHLLKSDITAEEKNNVNKKIAWLLMEHWQQWLPPFINTALATPGLTPGVTAMMTHFHEWITQEIASLSRSATTK